MIPCGSQYFYLPNIHIWANTISNHDILKEIIPNCVGGIGMCEKCISKYLNVEPPIIWKQISKWLLESLAFSFSWTHYKPL